MREPNGYKLRLRAAVKALCWWKPWHSYYAHEYDYNVGYEHGHSAGYRQGKDEGISLRSGHKGDEHSGPEPTPPPGVGLPETRTDSWESKVLRLKD